MADNISIVMTMKTDIDARMKPIASTTLTTPSVYKLTIAQVKR